MKKTSLTVLVLAAILGISAAATVGINHSNIINEIHEVHANGVHQHDGITFDQEWTSSNKLPTEEGNYYLANDVIMTAFDYTWIVKKNISLCLNGHKIVAYTSDYSMNEIYLSSSASNTILNLCDCGTEEHKAVWHESGEYLIVDDNADAKDVVTTFTGGYITNFRNNYVIKAAKTNTVNFYGGTIIGNGTNYSADASYAIIGDGGDVNMFGGNILGNRFGGIGIYSTSPTTFGALKLLGGRISYQKKSAVSCSTIRSDETFVVQNIEISDNTGDGNGGAGGINSNVPTIIKSGTVIKNNHSKGNGGGIKFNNGGNATLTIEGGEISNNDAIHTGGGIYLGDGLGYMDLDKPDLVCTMTGGVIKNNTAAEGGGVSIYTASKHNAIFNMSGGKINNNSATGSGGIANTGKGGGIFLYATDQNQKGNIANISGGEIKNNTANTTGGGISVTQNTTLSLAGNPDISGNTSGSESISDEIYMDYASYKEQQGYVNAMITIPSGIDDDANFGIRMDAPGVFTRGLSDGDAYLSHFTSLDDSYSVYVNNSEQLYLDVAHTHTWSYVADGAKITASCTPECPVTTGLTLELEAPTSLTYDGSAKVATFKTGYSSVAFPSPSIKYYQGTSEVTSCVNAGTYTAKVTFGTATAVLEFTIAKATPTPAAVPDQNAVYGQSLSEIALPDGWSWNNPSAKVGNAGTNQHKATFTPEDADNYNTVEQNVNVIVAKADPEYTIPTGLTALVNKTLSTVTLPNGWTWDDPTQNVGSELGNKVFKGTFTPEDTTNYNIIEHVDITVLVTEHEHNWSYTASGATITASCGNPECPVTEGLTLTLQAPTGDMHYDGNAKAATLKAGYSLEAFPNATIKYFKDNAEVNQCVNVGVYTAKVTFGNAVAMVEFEILGKTIVDPTQPSTVEMEIDDAVVPENVELRVEVRTDVAEKDIAEDYAKIQAKLESNEQISKVYDVKLIQTVGGVEKEIQPSDIQPGLKITVKMAIPEGVDINNVRILHIHSVNDMEFVSDYKIEGNELVFEIDRLSQFAFITKVNTPAAGGVNGGIIALIIILSILATLGICFCLLFFVFAKFIIVKDKEGKEKVARAIKIGKDHKDDKDYFWMFTFTFKKDLKPEDEVFSKKKDAEEFLKNKVQEGPKE